MGYTVCQHVAMSFPQLTSERYSRTSGQALCHLPTAAALRFWCGIAVLPCFSASGKVPVTRCGLPLRGTYAACGAYAPRKPLAGENDSTFSSGAAYWSSSRLDCHTLPATTLRKVVAPIPSGQTGLDASRQAQFSASIVISM